MPGKYFRIEKTMDLRTLLAYVEANRKESKRELSRKLGISTTAYWRIMNGKNTPDAEVLFNMVELMGYQLTLSVKI